MTLYFHDASNNNPDYQPTGPTIFKATEGTDFIDGEFARVRQQTLAGGWPFLGYHFLHPGNVQAQVSLAISVVGNGQPLMLDVETVFDGTWPALSDVVQFTDLYAQQSGGGRVTLDYIPEWFWSGHWGSPSLAPISQRGTGLISSNYTAYSDTGPGWNPYGGITPIIWQYTSTPLDTNAFKGTQDQLAAVFAGGHASVPKTGDSKMYRTVVIDAALNATRNQIYLSDGMGLRVVGDPSTADYGEHAFWGSTENAYMIVGTKGRAPAGFVELVVPAGMSADQFLVQKFGDLPSSGLVAHTHNVSATGPAVAG